MRLYRIKNLTHDTLKLHLELGSTTLSESPQIYFDV